MDIKFLRPHELVVSVDTGPGGVQAVANGSEAKIADAMLRELHRQGVLADAGHDLRFSMRPGGNPGRGEFGGVVEAFLTPGEGRRRRSSTASASRSWRSGRAARRRLPARSAARASSRLARVRRRGAGAIAARAAARPCAAAGRRAALPGSRRPAAASRPRGLVSETLARLAALSHDDYRYLVEQARVRRRRVRGWRGRRRRPRLRPARAGRAAQAGRLLRPGRQGALVDRVPDRRRPRRRRARPRAASPACSTRCRCCPRRWRRGGPGRRRLAARRSGRLVARPVGPPHGRDPRRPAAAVRSRPRRARGRLRRLRERVVRPDLRLALRGRGRAPGLAQPGRLRLPRRPALPGRQPRRRDGAPARGVVLELFGRESGDFLGRAARGRRDLALRPGPVPRRHEGRLGLPLRAAGRPEHLLLRGPRRHAQRLGLGLALCRRRPEQGACWPTARRRRRA